MKQEAQIVMLPTEDINAPVCIYNRDGIPTTDTHTLAPHTNQHLYITVSQEIEPIKEGDWYLFEGHTIIKHGDISLHKSDRKIIATTDKSLLIYMDSKPFHIEDREVGLFIRKEGKNYKYLPQIPQTFVKEYCEKGGIDKVMVEYERDYENRTCESCNLFDEVCELKLEKKCCTATKDVEAHGDYWISRMDEEEDSVIYKLVVKSDNTINISPINKVAKIYFSEEDLQDMQSSKYGEGLWNTWNYTLPSGEVIYIELHLGSED